jgi:dihydrofolate reductase
VFNLVTLDGFFAGPNGEIDWHNYDEEMGGYSIEQLKSLGALMFGRTTYDIMASYWPTPEAARGEAQVADMMNNIPKIIFSKSIQEVKDGPRWKNVRLFHEIKPEEIMELKREDQGDIAIFGSGTIVQQLANLNLIDEFRVIINPLLLGNGKPLFKGVKNKLKLVKTRVFANGNVLLCYKPATN